MRVLALDPGTKRIGLAISDPLGLTVRPLATLEGLGRQALFHRLEEIVRRYGVERIVVGLPLHMDGSLSPAAQRAQRLAQELARHLGIEVELWDERLTTEEAEAWLEEAPPARRRRPVDAIAAAFLLRDYLEAHRSPHP